MALFRLLLVMALAVCGMGLAPAPGPAHPGSDSTRPGVVNGLLERQVLRVQRDAHQLLAQGKTEALVPLEVISTRDVRGEIRSLGGQVEADIRGKVIAAKVPANRVGDLAKVHGVVSVYPSVKSHPELDLAVPEIRANQAWTLHDPHDQAVQGKHVLVGIVDKGIDYRNPDFKNPDGSTRIKYIWDQTTAGHPPDGYFFGAECDSASINSGQCPERDTDGHGTHVAGIAAGNGLSSSPPKEIGVAPQADLIVVKTDLSELGVLTGWQYLVDKARQLGEPIVINDSFGSQLGPHDGTEPEAQGINLLSGPGVVFVKSAGDSGGQGAHVDGTIAQGGTASISFDASGYASTMQAAPQLSLALFYPARDTLSFSLTSAGANEIIGPVHQNGRFDAITLNGGDTEAWVDDLSWNAQYRYLFVELKSTSGQTLTGHYSLQLQGDTIVDGGRYDAWMQQEGFGHFGNADPADTLSIPADADKAISVGDYASRVTWTDQNNQQHNVCDLLPCPNGPLVPGQIEGNSGQGPTADGRQKPDISAPGLMIVSSLSGDAVHNIDPKFITPDSKNLVLGGSSMSAAMVTGVVALMLQAEPSLDPGTVDAMLRGTARHDQLTGPGGWTPAFGAGKVDAYAAVMDAIAAPHPTPTPTGGPTPTPVFPLPPLPKLTPALTPVPPAVTSTPDPPSPQPTKTKMPPTPTPVPTATPKPKKTPTPSAVKKSTKSAKKGHKTRPAVKCKKGYRVVHGTCRWFGRAKTTGCWPPMGSASGSATTSRCWASNCGVRCGSGGMSSSSCSISASS